MMYSPGTFDSYCGVSSGSAAASALGNLMPQASTNLRGGTAPMRAMMRLQGTRASPLSVREHENVRPLAAFRRALDRRDLRLVEALDALVVDRLENRAEVALLHAHELIRAIDDEDAVLLREPERVLDGGIARADHDDGFVAVLVRIVQRVLHARQIVARQHRAGADCPARRSRTPRSRPAASRPTSA